MRNQGSGTHCADVVRVGNIFARCSVFQSLSNQMRTDRGCKTKRLKPCVQCRILEGLCKQVAVCDAILRRSGCNELDSDMHKDNTFYSFITSEENLKRNPLPSTLMLLASPLHWIPWLFCWWQIRDILGFLLYAIALTWHERYSLFVLSCIYVSIIFLEFK